MSEGSSLFIAGGCIISHLCVAWCALYTCTSNYFVGLTAACACAGIVYGLYLTLSTWILYYVATKMNFFEQQCHLPSLNNEARPSSVLSSNRRG